MQNKQFTLTISFIISSLIFLITIFSVFTKSLWAHILDLQSFYWFLNTFGEPKMNFKGNWFNDFMTFLASYGDIATFITLTLIIATIVLIKRRFSNMVTDNSSFSRYHRYCVKRHHSSFKTL